MIGQPPRSTLSSSSAASDVYKRQDLEDVEAKLGIEFECEDIDTLSGFMIYKLGKIPDDGENFEVEYKGYIFRTLDVRGRMILKVKVEKTSQGQHA